jgi:hypothetical protein
MNPKKYLSDGYRHDDDLPEEDTPGRDRDEDESVEDPSVAKLLESKQFRELEEKVDMMMGVLEELISSLEQAGSDNRSQNSPPQDNKPQEAQDKKPVQFEADPGHATSMPGPNNTYQPSFSSREKTKSSHVVSYSRSNNVKKDPYIQKLESTIKELQLKFARSEAANKVAQLKSEGYLFGDTPQDAAEGEADEIEFLAHMTPEEQDYHINQVIRKRYKRQKPVPGTNGTLSVAQYSRSAFGERNLEEFEPETTEEAAHFADLIAVKKLSRIAAARECMRLRREREQLS